MASAQEITLAAPIVSPATKAVDKPALYGDTFPDTWTLKIAACWHQGEFGSEGNVWGAGNIYMPATEYAYAGLAPNTWASSGDKYYWPKNGKLTFSAFAPADLNAVIDETGVNIGNAENLYALGLDGSQKDLMYSDRATNKTVEDDRTYENAYNGVQVNFRHALSAIVFNVKTEAAYEDVTITVKSIRLKNIYNKGFFKQNLTAGTASSTLSAWTPETGEAAYTHNFANIITDEAGITVESTEKRLWQDTNILDMLIMPFAFVNDSHKLEVVYEIDPENGAAIEQTYEVALNSLKYSDAPDPASLGEFKPGSKYIFNIIFTLDEIHVAPMVIDWDEVTIVDAENRPQTLV